MYEHQGKPAFTESLSQALAQAIDDAWLTDADSLGEAFIRRSLHSSPCHHDDCRYSVPEIFCFARRFGDDALSAWAAFYYLDRYHIGQALIEFYDEGFENNLDWGTANRCEEEVSKSLKYHPRPCEHYRDPLSRAAHLENLAWVVGILNQHGL